VNLPLDIIWHLYDSTTSVKANLIDLAKVQLSLFIQAEVINNKIAFRSAFRRRFGTSFKHAMRCLHTKKTIY